MIVGYARTSAVEQAAGLQAQEHDLRAAGAERVFAEQVSSVAKRDQLKTALDFVREGDTLVVSNLTCVGRLTVDEGSRRPPKGIGLISAAA